MVVKLIPPTICPIIYLSLLFYVILVKRSWNRSSLSSVWSVVCTIPSTKIRRHIEALLSSDILTKVGRYDVWWWSSADDDSSSIFIFYFYIAIGAANLALKNMDDVNLGVGRNIRVSRCSTATYFSQDETATGKVYNHF